MPSLATLNALPAESFKDVLAEVFEHAPWVAAAVLPRRPFVSVGELHWAMCDAVAAAGEAAQRTLICAHPDLAGKAARAGELTDASSREQAGAGLEQLGDSEYQRFHELNDRYRERFAFPFILAVKGHTKTSILSAFEVRLTNTPAAERETALQEIYQIARLRLGVLMGDA